MENTRNTIKMMLSTSLHNYRDLRLDNLNEYQKRCIMYAYLTDLIAEHSNIVVSHIPLSRILSTINVKESSKHDLIDEFFFLIQDSCKQEIDILIGECLTEIDFKI